MLRKDLDEKVYKPDKTLLSHSQSWYAHQSPEQRKWRRRRRKSDMSCAYQAPAWARHIRAIPQLWCTLAIWHNNFDFRLVSILGNSLQTLSHRAHSITSLGCKGPEDPIRDGWVRLSQGWDSSCQCRWPWDWCPGAGQGCKDQAEMALLEDHFQSRELPRARSLSKLLLKQGPLPLSFF